jgi:hypothetical protein
MTRPQDDNGRYGATHRQTARFARAEVVASTFQSDVEAPPEGRLARGTVIHSRLPRRHEALSLACLNPVPCLITHLCPATAANPQHIPQNGALLCRCEAGV